MDAIYFTLLFKALVMGGRNINISLRLPSMRKTPIRPRRRDTDARFSAPPIPPSYVWRAAAAPYASAEWKGGAWL